MEIFEWEILDNLVVLALLRLADPIHSGCIKLHRGLSIVRQRTDALALSNKRSSLGAP